MDNVGINGNPGNNAGSAEKETAINADEMEDAFTGRLYGKEAKIDKIKTVKMKYTKRKKEERKELRSNFNNKRKAEYCKEIANKEEVVKLLKELNVSQKEIDFMKEKGIVPKGFQVHHKKPLDDGGDNSSDNLVLIKNHPYHKMITNYQNANCLNLKEGETVELDFPCDIPGSVYPPESEKEKGYVDLLEKFDKNKTSKAKGNKRKKIATRGEITQ